MVQSVLLKACWPDLSKGHCHHEGPLACTWECFSEVQQLWKNTGRFLNICLTWNASPSKPKRVQHSVDQCCRLSVKRATQLPPMMVILFSRTYTGRKEDQPSLVESVLFNTWLPSSFPFVHELYCECLKANEWMNWTSMCSCDKKYNTCSNHRQVVGFTKAQSACFLLIAVFLMSS